MCPAPACISIDSLVRSGDAPDPLPIPIPPTPNRFACRVSFAPMLTFATKTGNGQKADGTSPFVSAVLKKLSCWLGHRASDGEARRRRMALRLAGMSAAQLEAAGFGSRAGSSESPGPAATAPAAVQAAANLRRLSRPGRGCQPDSIRLGGGLSR